MTSPDGRTPSAPDVDQPDDGTHGGESEQQASGRSSRSTFTFTKCSFMYAAVASSSNDSWAMTWHQWQAA